MKQQGGRCLLLQIAEGGALPRSSRRREGEDVSKTSLTFNVRRQDSSFLVSFSAKATGYTMPSMGAPLRAAAEVLCSKYDFVQLFAGGDYELGLLVREAELYEDVVECAVVCALEDFPPGAEEDGQEVNYPDIHLMKDELTILAEIDGKLSQKDVDDLFATITEDLEEIGGAEDL